MSPSEIHNTLEIQTSAQPLLVPCLILILLLPRIDNTGEALCMLVSKKMPST